MSYRRQTQSRFFLLMLALVAGCVLGALGLPVFRGASAQSSNGKFNGLIAFSTNRNGPAGEIYVMNPDGSNQHNITNSPACSGFSVAWLDIVSAIEVRAGPEAICGGSQ